jgi:prepilin-type N-terminal cleavage/methylation domain-containing protein
VLKRGTTALISNRGLSLVELLVVLAIIAVLLGLLLPAVQAARERARETVCKNNLHQLNLALGQFAEVHKQLPPPFRPGKVGGWTVEILPFLEQGNLKDVVSQDLALRDVPPILHTPPVVFRCPRRTTLDALAETSMWPSHYVLVPTTRRESFLLYDAPVHVNVPWLTGPEMRYQDIVTDTGPHHGGFFFASGFQQGVSFMLNGREIR